MPARPRDAAVRENGVDTVGQIVGSPDGRTFPRKVAQNLHVENAVLKITVDEALVAGAVGETQIVVVRLAERRRDMLSGEIDDLLGRSARVLFALGEAQSAIVDEHSRRDESLAGEPQAVVEAHRRLIGASKAGQ